VTATSRRRAAALAGLAAVVVAAGGGVLALRGGGGGGAIAQDAARLVPADALVYVHISTDGGRDAVKAANALAKKFPSWPALRDSVLRRLSVTASQPVAPWLGKEAALALLSSSTGTAGSLVVLDVRDMAKARRFVEAGTRNAGPAQSYRGVSVQRFGALSAAFLGNDLVIGQADSIHRAVDLRQGRGHALAGDSRFKASMSGLAADRVADVYATGEGVRRLLAPAGGLLGAAGALLERPGLKSVGLALSARDPGARVQVHSLASPPPANKRGSASFKPTLAGQVPTSALAYIAVKGIDTAAGRLAGAALAGASPGGLQGLLAGASKALGAQAAAVQGQLLGPLRGETALSILPSVPAPTLVLIARTPDEKGARRALSALAGPLTKVLRGGRVTRKRVAGEDIVSISVGPRFSLEGGAFDGKLVIATADSGIAAAKDPKGGIDSGDGFRTTLPDGSKRVSSLVFLDFSQLLKLGEKTGLNTSRAYLRVKDDLSKVRSIGAGSTANGGDATAEILFQIP